MTIFCLRQAKIIVCRCPEGIDWHWYQMSDSCGQATKVCVLDQESQRNRCVIIFSWLVAGLSVSDGQLPLGHRLCRRVLALVLRYLSPQASSNEGRDERQTLLRPVQSSHQSSITHYLTLLPLSQRSLRHRCMNMFSHFYPKVKLKEVCEKCTEVDLSHCFSVLPSSEEWRWYQFSSRQQTSKSSRVFSLSDDSTWGLPSASSCSSRMFFVAVTSPSNLSYSLHDRSSSWFGHRRTLWRSALTMFVFKRGNNRVQHVCVCVCVCEYGAWLTAVILESSLQVLSRPLCSKSLCWMTPCMAAGLSEPISISWLADNSAVSRVCWRNKRLIKRTYTVMLSVVVVNSK